MSNYPVIISQKWLFSFLIKTFLVAQSVKNLPVVQETRVWSLGQEDPLEKEMATQKVLISFLIKHNQFNSSNPVNPVNPVDP